MSTFSSSYNNYHANKPDSDAGFSRFSNRNNNQSVNNENQLHTCFVGELGPETDQNKLKEYFNQFGYVIQAKIILDSKDQTSKGYGFVSYGTAEELNSAIKNGNGTWLDYRLIKVNFASRNPSKQKDGRQETKKYEDVYKSASDTNRTIYLGNLELNTDAKEVEQACREIGAIESITIKCERGFGFAKYKTKDEACKAICSLDGKAVGGVNLKCNWGRDESTKRNLSEISNILQPNLPSSPTLAYSVMVNQNTPFGSSQSPVSSSTDVQKQLLWQQQQQQLYYQQMMSNPNYQAYYQQMMQQQQQQNGAPSSNTNPQNPTNSMQQSNNQYQMNYQNNQLRESYGQNNYNNPHPMNQNYQQQNFPRGQGVQNNQPRM